MDERVLAERLITYDTSKPEALRAGAAFIKGWLEARDIEARDRDFDGLPVVLADVGAREGPTVETRTSPRSTSARSVSGRSTSATWTSSPPSSDASAWSRSRPRPASTGRAPRATSARAVRSPV